MPKNNKSHKRQKSSILNIGFYYPDEQPDSSRISGSNVISSAGPSNLPKILSNLNPDIQSNINDLSPMHQQVIPHHMTSPSHPTHQQQQQQQESSPTLDNSLYESDIYNPINYNFPTERSTFFYPMNQNLNQPYNLDTYQNPTGQSSTGMHGAHLQTNTSMSVPSYIQPPAPPQLQPQAYQIPISQPLQPNQQILSQQPFSASSDLSKLPSQSSNIQTQLQTPHTPRTSQRSSPIRRHAKAHSRSHSHSTPNSLTNLAVNKPTISLPKHKQNLSISSHFNLFNLTEQQPKEEFDQNRLLNDLLFNLIEVDQASVNNFLLNALDKIDVSVPLDDFYNLLYHDSKTIKYNTEDKLDKTKVDNQYLQNCLEILFQVLEIFKEPESIKDFLSNKQLMKEIKLSNINYHELLRSFLAIKILQDMLIELPRNSSTDITTFNIPRLSLYKTYYIICQNLLLKYPSSIDANNDHHKLILGQSKLGKLIKLVYPNLLIKRLGSRGESKYNYLGVVWNENIVNNEIVELCDSHELVDLNQIFDSKHKAKLESDSLNRFNESVMEDTNEILAHQASSHLGSGAGPSMLASGLGDVSSSAGNVGSLEYLQPSLHSNLLVQQPFDFKSESFNLDYNKSVYSFLNNQNLRFPANFQLIGWIDSVKFQIYQDFNLPVEEVLTNLINSISVSSRQGSGVSEHSNVASHSSEQTEDEGINHDYLGNLLAEKLSEVNFDWNTSNNDLKIYFLLLAELTPHLLLLKPTTNLKLMKTHINNFLNGNETDLHLHLNSRNQTNLINFKLILKNLLNLNDLLINITKIIFNDTSILHDLLSFFNYDQTNESNDSILNSFIDNLIIFTTPESLNYTFINNQISNMKNWFLGDLTNFLENIGHSHLDSDPNPSYILNDMELANLLAWLNLINVLIESFNQFPIIFFTSFFNLVSNDLLKTNYLHNFQQQVNFNHYWILICFIQDYINFVGELFGLYNEI